MDHSGVNYVWICVTFATMLMAGMIHSVSAYCSDPGTPTNGDRTIESAGFVFHVGTVIHFSCTPYYTLIGAKKIMCRVKKNTGKYYWNGKKPLCKSQVCPLPPPNITHAAVTTNPVVNTKGSYVYYACNRGYTPEPAGLETRLLCDKDSTRQGYIWSGNFMCKKKPCASPPYIRNGNYSLYIHDSVTIATYYCFPTYILKKEVTSQIAYLMRSHNTSCDGIRYWPAARLSCVKTCTSDIALRHGSFGLAEPFYFMYGLSSTVYAEGQTVKFNCDTHYRLTGSSSRTCLRSGLWSGIEPRCVVSSCAKPMDISNGRSTANSTKDSDGGLPIWTILTFTCNRGYQLKGAATRQCKPNGHWSGYLNPTCQKSDITCGVPTSIPNGQYAPVKLIYLVNAHVSYTCTSGYFLWGAESLKCFAIPGKLHGVWLKPKCDSLYSEHCDGQYVNPECLLPGLYKERCKESGGRVNFGGRNPSCVKRSGTDDPATPEVMSFNSSDNELDKMTIVVATAGSTLGALVVLLTALVCFRRFHRSRRCRPSAFYRGRRHSDDDRIAIIAACAGDVHFILPSYDEAMRQEESSPPPFESVGQSDNNTPSNANSQPTGDNAGDNAAGTADAVLGISNPAASAPEVVPSAP